MRYGLIGRLDKKTFGSIWASVISREWGAKKALGGQAAGGDKPESAARDVGPIRAVEKFDVIGGVISTG